jgi:MFS transporter, DHA2 family, multidrug resistance protein
MVPLINQAVVGLTPQQMPSGIALTNMIRQLGGAFGIAVMNTYVTNRYAAHRNDLVSNLQLNDPDLVQRLAGYKAALVQGGMNVLSSVEGSYRILELTVTKQSYLMAYLDGFTLISIFFVCAIPFLFMLKTKKMDKATLQKVQEESH